MLARQLPKTIAEHSHSEINRLTVLNRDILTLQRPDLAEEPTALVANLPYNVAVPRCCTCSPSSRRSGR